MTENICIGCLSHNRKLTPLAEEQKHLWWLISEQTFHMRETLPLCWECVCFVRKLNRFRRRVAIATDTLSTHLELPPKVTQCLSNLSISTTERTATESFTETSLRHFRPRDKPPDHLKTTNDTTDARRPSDVFHTSFRAFGKSSDQRTLDNLGASDTKSVIDDGTQNPDTLFVKVEDVDDDGDYDGDAGEVLGDEVRSDVEKVETVIDIKSDERPRKASSDGFNESDDEPLHRRKVTTDKETTGKKRRRKPKASKQRTKEGIVTNKKALKKLQQLNVEEGSLQIVELTWEQVEEERQRARESEAFQRLHYKCHDCVVGFNHRSKMDNHMRKHEPSAGSECCEVCRVRCRDTRALQQHSRRHRLRWRCTRCGLGWSRAAVAADHVARAHGAAPAQHRCRHAHCHHVATSLAALRLHAKSHMSRVPCPLCGVSLRDRASLRAHALTHGHVREHACSTCPKRFLFRKACELHMLTHVAPKHLYCHECDKTFKNQMSYYGHMKYNLKHIDPAKLKHICPECGKRFAKAVRLREHRAAIHLHLTPERCDHPGCSFACASRPVLRAHRRSVHARDGAPRKRDHVCHACGKAYTTKSSLAGHLRAHTGARPLRCPRCPAAFAYDAALYNHTRRVHKQSTLKTQPLPPASSPPPLPSDE